MKRSTIVEIISALFILLFIYTAISKLFTISRFQAVLHKSPLIGKIAPLLAWSLPTLEVLVALFLFIPKTRRWGLYSSLGLMVGFTGYLAYMIYATPNLPCSCGGVIGQMTWNEHLVFNIFFLLMALIGIILNKKRANNYKNNKSEELSNIAFT